MISMLMESFQASRHPQNLQLLLKILVEVFLNFSRISKNDLFLKTVLPSISEKICAIGAPFEHLVFNDNKKLEKMRKTKYDSDTFFVSCLPFLEKLSEIIRNFISELLKTSPQSIQCKSLILQFSFQVLAKLFSISEQSIIDNLGKIEKSKEFMVLFSSFFSFF